MWERQLAATSMQHASSGLKEHVLHVTIGTLQMHLATGSVEGTCKVVNMTPSTGSFSDVFYSLARRVWCRGWKSSNLRVCPAMEPAR